MYFLQMAGSPGCGKSTLAREIGIKTNAVVIDHDIIKSAYMESTNDSDNLYAGKVSYNIDWSLIDFHLSQGFNVIFDSPCFYDVIIPKGKELAMRHNAEYKYIECYLNDIQEVDRRLRTREPMRCQYTALPEGEEGERYKRGFNKSIRPDTEYIAIDTSYPIDSYMERVLDYIGRVKTS
ncbi:AAA family ATPase [Pontibacillus sp. HMF3514]|uniref:AAA family ATPase n=1 Tax=Pontibacillus sp. HMF3514 TaxID=2692425 RepID=UPI00131F9B9C|nr:AAA family ATPase [Pontibacillus sp. HMF3514]QHE52827.1 AAA family ATPase [Pontibacillus sp. HMF3514]